MCIRNGVTNWAYVNVLLVLFARCAGSSLASLAHVSSTLCTVGHGWLSITHVESLGPKTETFFYGCMDKSDPEHF